MNESFWDGTASTNDIDIPAFFDSGVIDGVISLLQMGVLVSIGTTRDRGAIALAVFNGGKRRREYFRDPTDAADFLRSAVESLSRAGVSARNGHHQDR